MAQVRSVGEEGADSIEESLDDGLRNNHGNAKASALEVFGRVVTALGLAGQRITQTPGRSRPGAALRPSSK